MTHSRSQSHRMLAIAPSSRGFGFAVMESEGVLIDWGVKSVSGSKNAQSVDQIGSLITQYEPTQVVFEDLLSPGVRRAPRIHALIGDIAELAVQKGVKIKRIKRQHVRRSLFQKGKATKQTIAEELGRRYPNELGFSVPGKRKPWMSQDYRMDMFDAVALAECFVKQKRTATPEMQRELSEE